MRIKIKDMLLRIIAAILVFCIIFSMSSCGIGQDVTVEQDIASNQNEQSENSSLVETSKSNVSTDPDEADDFELNVDPDETSKSASDNSASKILPVDMIYQNPELPSGCEVTSAAMLLQYVLGQTVDKLELADYVKTDGNFYFDSQEDLIGPDPQKIFVGSPFGEFYGCFNITAKNFINRYLKAIESDKKAIIPDNPDLQDIIEYIDNDMPVMVWASIDMGPLKYTENNSWYIISESGVKIPFTWPRGEHCLVIYGYETVDGEVTLHFCDPMEGKRSFPAKQFLEPFEELSNMAIVIE